MAQFQLAFERLSKVEGGYVNNVNDKEINCKLLMFNAKNYAKYYSQ